MELEVGHQVRTGKKSTNVLRLQALIDCCEKEKVMQHSGSKAAPLPAVLESVACVHICNTKTKKRKKNVCQFDHKKKKSGLCCAFN